MPYTPKPEHALQNSVANFFRAHMPPDVPWSSADHGITFRGSAIQRANTWNRLAARGVAKGLHDIPIILYRGRLLSIELKRPGEEPRPEQIAWGDKIVAQGGYWACCATRREVWDAVCAAYPDDNPLKPPPALLQWWLAKDDAEVVAKVRKAAKPRAAKATRKQINTWNAAMTARKGVE